MDTMDNTDQTEKRDGGWGGVRLTRRPRTADAGSDGRQRVRRTP
jgi:hypothetical protein